jgi:hypothetical protein
MRHVMAVLGIGVVAAAVVGCNSTRWNHLKPPDNVNPTANPVADGRAPSVASLIDYLNENAGRVKTLQAASLDVTASQENQRINLRGKMVAEKPRGFRMSLDGPLGFSQVADLGSNNDEFWFWIKGPIGQAAPPQYYCSYRDLEKGVAMMPMPFQPEWIMETLGLGPYGPADRYQLESDDQTLRLVEKTRSPQGGFVRKVIVMKRRETKAPDPQVTHYLLIDDATNKEICSAHITQTFIDSATGSILPKRLELNWRQQNATLSIIFDKLAVNGQLPSADVFVRRPPNGVQTFNLARGQADTMSLQRVQGVQPK